MKAGELVAILSTMDQDADVILDAAAAGAVYAVTTQETYRVDGSLVSAEDFRYYQSVLETGTEDEYAAAYTTDTTKLFARIRYGAAVEMVEKIKDTEPATIVLILGGED